MRPSPPQAIRYPTDLNLLNEARVFSEKIIDKLYRPTDLGSQFTSPAFTGVLKDHGIRISMDRKGAWLDNVFIERLWRSVKYEEVYLHAYDTVSDSRTGIGRYFDLYNQRRPHSSW